MPEEALEDENLSGLNDEDRKILEDLEKEGYELEGFSKKESEKEETKEPAEEKSEEETKEESETEKAKDDEKEEKTEEEEPKDKEESEEEPKKRDIKFVPAWELVAAKKTFEKREKSLLEEVEKLRKDVTKQPEEKDTDLSKRLTDVGVDEKVAEAIVTSIRSEVESRSKNPELEKRLKALDEYEKQRIAQVEEAEYEKDFGTNIVSLVRAEYPDISEADIATVKQKLKEVAYSPGNTATDLKVLYKGLDNFRGMFGRKKTGIESTKRGRSTEPDLENVTEDEAKNLSPDDFLKFSDNMARREGKLNY